MKLRVQVIGTMNVMKNISLWQAVRFPKEIRKALEITAKKIEDDARRMAPKETGVLKASIYSKIKSDTVAVIGDGVYYGYYVEVGAGPGHSPQPFLRPAFEANRKTFNSELKEILK